MWNVVLGRNGCAALVGRHVASGATHPPPEPRARRTAGAASVLAASVRHLLRFRRSQDAGAHGRVAEGVGTLELHDSNAEVGAVGACGRARGRREGGGVPQLECATHLVVLGLHGRRGGPD